MSGLGAGPAITRVDQAEVYEALWSDESLGRNEELPRVTPDLPTCPACLQELLDPTDRRYRYAFISCPECGPRFSIIESLPFGRERTSMRLFPMCEECAREYEDPTNRRFHAELVTCAVCGPRLTLLGPSESGPHPGNPIQEVAAMLRNGSIVAVKDLGGFHLACDATNETAVAELRRRVGRPTIPFAVMVANPEEAGKLFDPTSEEAGALSSAWMPIVLVRGRGLLAPSVAPMHRRQGLMLASTPLQHLLLREIGRPLVMTSGNRSDAPISRTTGGARRRLSKKADAFLVHDLEILAPLDDSAATVRGGGPVLLRGGRGSSPGALRLPDDVRPTLAVGGAYQGTFCLAQGTQARISENLGELDSARAISAYAQVLERYLSLFHFEPEVVAHDLDTGLSTTRLAQHLGLPAVAVQQHHSRIASVMAEHALQGRVIGVAFDGSGLGEDGTAWGGEFLVCDWATAERAGLLRPVLQPGGDTAVRNPVRMALSHAADAGVLKDALPLIGTDRSHAKLVLAQIESGQESLMTSSAGRLIDAVSALVGVCRQATYHGEPAVALEEVADQSATFEYPFELNVDGGRVILDTRPIVGAVVRDLSRGRGPGEVAGRFHRTMAAAILSVCRLLRGRTGLTRVCLGGGVFQDDLLTSDLCARLAACDFEVFVPREVPVGDEGIALGQVLVAHGRREMYDRVPGAPLPRVGDTAVDVQGARSEGGSPSCR